jgi:ribokinase
MITVVGSLNMDLVINAKKIPRPGETVMGRSFKQIPGGKGGNQADAAAKLGSEVCMIGCVGDDAMGKLLISSLKADGVNVDSVLVKAEAATGVAAIVVEDSGDNAITVAPGANYALTAQDIEGISAVIEKSAILLLQLEITMETVRASLRIAKSAGTITILNPAPAAELDAEMLGYIDILTPNETELEFLTGQKTETLAHIEIAGKFLLDQGVQEIVVTLGHNGCMHITKEGAKHYKAYKVKAVDTTAAGDSFTAALAVSLSTGKTMADAIGFASKVGAMTVTKEGAQTSLPLEKEVEDFDDWLKQHAGQKG